MIQLYMYNYSKMHFDCQSDDKTLNFTLNIQDNYKFLIKKNQKIKIYEGARFCFLYFHLLREKMVDFLWKATTITINFEDTILSSSLKCLRSLRRLYGLQINHQIRLKFVSTIFLAINYHLVKKKPNTWAL